MALAERGQFSSVYGGRAGLETLNAGRVVLFSHYLRCFSGFEFI